MASTSTSTILLPIFGGQTLNFSPESNSERFAQYTSFPSGAVLLDACYDAFHTELRTLLSDVEEQVAICTNDFQEKASILSPIHEKYLFNPVVSGTTLLLHQTLQYLYFAENFDYGVKERPLEAILCLNIQHKVGVIGSSLGLLTAAVVAASRTKLGFIKHAVEAYRLAFWVGVRVQLHRRSKHTNPWRLTITSNKSDVEQAALAFNKVCFLIWL
jgi:hypothetical protein